MASTQETRSPFQPPPTIAARARARLATERLRSEESRLALRREANADKVVHATRNVFAWLTESTQTYNEHWLVEGRATPYEPFPRHPYLEAVCQINDAERIIWWEKSRDMMLTWACVGYLLFKAMKIPECGNLFQCQKEDKSEQLVDYAKCLWERQDGILREAFPLVKPLNRQDKLTLEFANGSYLHGVPGGADQVRSYHPWGLLNDESSFQPEAGECFTEALSAVKGKIIFNSSAGPGWYADVRHDIVRTVE